MFGLLLHERVLCCICKQETCKVAPHYEHLIVVNGSTLKAAAQQQPDASMEQLLVSNFTLSKSCDVDVGGCGASNVSNGTVTVWAGSGILADWGCCFMLGGVLGGVPSRHAAAAYSLPSSSLPSQLPPPRVSCS